jgi:twinkle protein
MQYLTKERGITKETLETWKIGSKTGQPDSIAFPYRRGGEIVNVKYRFKGGKGEVWKNFSQEPHAERCLYGVDLVPEDATSLNICEGEIDALTLYQMGFPNTVSIPGGVVDLSWIERDWDWLKRFNTIYLVLDMDKAGRECADNIAKRLAIHQIFTVDLPEKDANRCLQKGLSREGFQTAFCDAREAKPEKLVTPEFFRQGIEEELLRSSQAEDGVQTEFPYLNELLRGFRPGELTEWSGRNGSGKSTLLLQLADHFCLSGQARVFVASFEMVPSFYLAWMVNQALVEEAHDPHLLDRLFYEWSFRLYILNHVGKILPDDLLPIMTYAARRYGCSQFFIDSLMMIALPSSERLEAEARFVGQLKDFALKEGAHVHLALHPRKGEKDSDVPDKADIKGSTEITDLADNVLIIHRPAELGAEGIVPPTSLRLLKNRKYGAEGHLSLEFFPAAKLFSQLGKPCPRHFKIVDTRFACPPSEVYPRTGTPHASGAVQVAADGR